MNTDERLAIVKPGAEIFCFAVADGVCRFEVSLAEVNVAEVNPCEVRLAEFRPVEFSLCEF